MADAVPLTRLAQILLCSMAFQRVMAEDYISHKVATSLFQQHSRPTSLTEVRSALVFLTTATDYSIRCLFERIGYCFSEESISLALFYDGNVSEALANEARILLQAKVDSDKNIPIPAYKVGNHAAEIKLEDLSDIFDGLSDLLDGLNLALEATE